MSSGHLVTSTWSLARHQASPKQPINSIKWGAGIILTWHRCQQRPHTLPTVISRWTTHWHRGCSQRQWSDRAFPGTIRARPTGTAVKARFTREMRISRCGAPSPTTRLPLLRLGPRLGRGGSARLARVPQGFVPDLTKYQSTERRLEGSKQAGRGNTHSGPAGEMVCPQHLPQAIPGACHQRYERRGGARTAPAPQGPWSAEQMLVKCHRCLAASTR